MSSGPWPWIFAGVLAGAPCSAGVVEPPPLPAAAAPATVDLLISFQAADGTPLEGKLTLPRGQTTADSPRSPVVFYLHGAGPRSFDNPFRYRDDDGQEKIGFYLDFHARRLAERGISFFRMSKRGCTALPEPPWMKLDRETFSKATPSILLGDYAAALAALRAREEIDAARIVLLGSSEGTRLAPQLAERSPEGIIGIAMVGFAADNARDIILWQNTVGPWRNVEHRCPAARDGRLTRQEYDDALAQDQALAGVLPFEPLDADTDGVLTSEELAAAVKPRLDAILKAVDDRNDDLLWRAVLNLSSDYLLEWWDAEPNVATLLKLNVPLAIFHGELDGACRVEGVREAAAAFAEAGKDNLMIKLYPDGDHDLNWTWEKARQDAVEEYEAVFQWIAEVLARGTK